MVQQTIASDSIHNSEQGVQDGLTKREYFAAMAMHGMCANSDYWHNSQSAIAEWSVKQADALIEALNKKK